MLWIPHQLVGVPIGYSVTLECHSEAHPTSLNYWTRDDNVMIHESPKYKVRSMPEKPSYKTNMTLTIFNVRVSIIFFLCNFFFFSVNLLKRLLVIILFF